MVNKLLGVIKCPHCGKEFIKNTMSTYKLIKKGKTVYYCGYTCWVAEDKRKYNFQKGEYVD